MDYDAIVIGAGAGGLSAGVTLASSGLKTLIVEQADFVGGCTSSFENSGFHFDVGACLIEMVRAHERLYERAGLEMYDYVKFIPNDPLYEMVDMLTGEHVLIPASAEGFAEIIGRKSPEDAKRFKAFYTRQGKMLDEFTDAVFTTPQGRMRDIFKVFRKCPRALRDMKYIFTPYKKLLEDMFEHQYTRRLLSHHTAIGGLPPSIQAGMLLWNAYAQHDGFYYPEGGMGAVPRGMAKAFEDLGGELRLGSQVDRIMLERGRARGVVLADGTAFSSRAVVSNANSKNLYMKMIGPENIPRAVMRGLESYEYSPSCTVAYLGLDYRPPMKAQHMIGMSSMELIESYWHDIYEKNIAIPEGVGLTSCGSMMDPDLAPEGCHTLTFINVAPRHPKNGSWQDIKWDYLERGINMLDTVYLPGIKDHIVFKTIATPEDFEKRLLIPNGSIYAYSMSLLSQMVFRPSNRSKCIEDLYLCGASSHVGSVPGAVCSGMLAADLAVNSLN